MIARLPNWENRLARVVSNWRGRPFRWNRDCARFAAACVIAQTGHDPIAQLRGRYRTKREALRLLAESPLPDRLDAMFPRLPAALARRGDIALTQGTCLGCVMGGEALFFTRENGMIALGRAEWEGVWGVGRDG